MAGQLDRAAARPGRRAWRPVRGDEVIPGAVWTRFLAQEFQLDLDHPGDVRLAAVVGELRRMVRQDRRRHCRPTAHDPPR